MAEVENMAVEPASPRAVAACGCDGFTRSEMLRAGAAEAGRGLPAIERGMPDPAGTGLTRRSFLWRSAGLAMAVYGGAAMGPRAFEEGLGEAMAAGPSDAVLVSVFLSGGIDSLSVLAPTGDPQYASLRPNLALTEAETLPFRGDDRLRWHSSAASLKTLHEEEKVTVFPAIGYTSPNHSHFTSRHYWEVGETNPAGQVGWLGRYLDRHGVANNPLQGLAMGTSLAPSLATATNPVAAVSRPESYTFPSPGVTAPIQTPMLNQMGALGSLDTSDPTLRKARAATASTARLREQVAPFSSFTSPVAYPTGNDFPRRMAALAAMLGAGLPLKVVAVQAAGSYDTHSSQEASLPNNLSLVSGTLAAFQRDLEARGLADRVLVHVWSEFGRRARDNGTGTDHGAAGASFIIGTRAKSAMVGEFPGLASGTGGGLDGGSNLRNTSDFRGVYSSLLEQWLGVDAAPIVPNAGSMPRYAVVK